MERSNFLTSLAVLILVLAYASATLSGPKAKKHFVLVHTAGHGAWSWYKIVALMRRSSGHNVTALNLGASGTNPKQALEIPHFSDYLSPLMEFMTSLPADEKVVLVGHSFGGFAVSKAMETFPEKISAAVFLSGLMPGPTLNASTVYTEAINAVITQPGTRVTYNTGLTNPPTTIILGPRYLATNVYQLSPIEFYSSTSSVGKFDLNSSSCSEVSFTTCHTKNGTGSIHIGLPIHNGSLDKRKDQAPIDATQIIPNDEKKDDLALATTLVRPFYLYRSEDVSKEIVLSTKRYGSVRRVFIVAAENKALNREFLQLMIEKNPPNEVKEI
ncbi:putative receptor protein kinase TMK1-like [Capsicum annuum]|nr:putative receptor protein kinase TMK1-like [Capsicum annuum]KAF3667196.1 putative receptor protein kinase TMK1-like [Capsicum annuum]